MKTVLLDIKSVSPSRSEWFCWKRRFHLTGKKTRRSIWKIKNTPNKRKQFLLAENSVSTKPTKDFVEKNFSTRSEKTINSRRLWKMVCTSHKISYLLEKMSSFFKNYFLLIPLMVFASRKIALTKKNTVSVRKKYLFALAVWRIMKTVFPVHRKTASF